MSKIIRFENFFLISILLSVTFTSMLVPIQSLNQPSFFIKKTLNRETEKTFLQPMKIILRHALKQIEDMHFLPFYHLLCVLKEYIKVLHEKSLIETKLLKSTQSFITQYTNQHDFIFFEPHFSKSFVKQSLFNFLKIFTILHQKQNPGIILVIDKRILNNQSNSINEDLVQIKKFYTQNYLSRNHGFFKHLKNSFFAIVNKQNPSKSYLKDKLDKYWKDLLFLKCINGGQRRLFQKIFSEILLIDKSTDISSFNQNLDDFIDKMLQQDYVFQKMEKALEDKTLENEDNLKHFVNNFWEESKNTHIDELKNIYQEIFNFYFQSIDANSLDSRKKALEKIKNAIFPKWNERNHFFKTFHIFSKALALNTANEKRKGLTSYSHELLSHKLISQKALTDIALAFDEIEKYQKKLPQMENKVVDRILTIHNIYSSPFSNQSTSIETKIKSMFQHDTKTLNNQNSSDFNNIQSIIDQEGLIGRKLASEKFDYKSQSTKDNHSKFMGFVLNKLNLKQDYEITNRKKFFTFWSRFIQFPNLVKKVPNPLTFHLENLTYLIKPFKTVSSLCKIRSILGRYFEGSALKSIIQPSEKLYYLKSILYLLLNTKRAQSKYNLCLSLQKYKDKLMFINTKPFLLKHNIIFSKSKPNILSKKTPIVLGRYHSEGPITSNIKKYIYQSILKILQKMKKSQHQHQIQMSFHKYTDKFIEPTVVRMKMTASQFIKQHFKMPQFKKKLNLVLGKYFEHTKLTPLPWNKDPRFQSIVKQLFSTKKNEKRSMNFVLKKTVDKWVKNKSVKMSGNYKYKPNIDSNKGSTRKFINNQLFSKNIQNSSIHPVKNDQNRFRSIILKSLIFAKLDSSKFNYMMKKSKDSTFKSNIANNKAKSFLITLQSLPGGGSIQKHQKLTPIAKIKTFRINPVINKNPRVFAFIQQNYPYKKNLASKFTFMLKRMKDKSSKNSATSQKLSSQLWLNKNEKSFSFSTNKTIILTHGKIKDIKIIDPTYGLAVLNCFERYFGDINFRTWTEALTAMKRYLDNIEGFDLIDMERAKIHRTLPFLKPFFKFGNLSFNRIYAKFQNLGSVVVNNDYQDFDLLHVLLKSIQNMKKEAEIHKLQVIIESAGNYLEDDLLKQIQEKFMNILLKKYVIENGQFNQKSDVDVNFDPFHDFEEETIKQLIEINSQNKNPSEQNELIQKLAIDVILMQLFKTPIKSIVDLKKKLFIFHITEAKELQSIDYFVKTNEQIISDVIGLSRFNDMSKLTSYLIKKENKVINYNELMKSDKKTFEDKLILTLAQNTLPSFFNLDNFTLIQNLFRKYAQIAFIVNDISSFVLSNQVEEKMGFCTHSSNKIKSFLDKMRSKIFWNEVKLNSASKMFFPQIFQNKIQKKMIFQHAKFKDNAKVLKPYNTLMLLKLFEEQFKNIPFKNDRIRHSYFGKIVDELKIKKALSQSQVQLVEKLFRNDDLFTTKNYNTRAFLGKISMNVFDVKLQAQMISASNRQGVFFPVSRGKNNNFALLAKVKMNVLEPILKGMKLKKDIKALFNGDHKSALRKSRIFMTNMKKLKIKYLLKNLQKSKKRVSSSAIISAIAPPTLKKFWRTIHFQRKIEKLKTMNYYRSVLNFMKDVKKTGNKSNFFSKTQFKTVLKVLLKKLAYFKQTNPLHSIIKRHFSPMKIVRFKTADKPLNLKLDFLKKLLSTSLYKSIKNNFISQKVLFKMLDNQTVKLEFRKFVRNYLKSHSILLNGEKMNSSKVIFKYLPFLKIENQLIQFVKKTLGPLAANKIKRLKDIKNTRVKFKKLVKIIIPSRPHMIFQRLKQSSSSKMRKFQSFLGEFKRMYLSKTIAGKRVDRDEKINFLRFVNQIYSLASKVLNGLNNDFGNLIFPEITKPGKKIERPENIPNPPKNNNFLRFVNKKFSFASKVKKEPNKEFGNYIFPEITKPGKKVERPEESPIPKEKLPPKIFCSCKCCFELTDCPKSSDCDCEKVQREANNDPTFYRKAKSILMFKPNVNFNFRVKNKDGLYEKYSSLNFRDKENEIDESYDEVESKTKIETYSSENQRRV